MMEQVRLFAVCPMENWLGSSLYQIQGWTTFRESYSRALKQRPLVSYSLHALPNVCGPSSSLHQLAGSVKTGLKVRDWMHDVLTQPSNV